MTKIPCGHDVLQPATCQTCLMVCRRPAYRAKYGFTDADIPPGDWGKPSETQPAKTQGKRLPLTPLPCVHLGQPTGETRPCKICGARDPAVPLRSCGVYGVCTETKRVAQQNGKGFEACCLNASGKSFCPGYQAPSPSVRNLLYHVAPASGNGVWRRNVEQLLRRIDLFNGRRVVAIVTGAAKRLDYKANFELDPPEDVMAAFKGHVHEFIVLPNNPALREVVTFVPLLERVAVTDPNQVTFYAHAKGVTRPVNPGVTVHRWTEIMYETCLDYWPLVEQQLAKYPITGSFKKVGHGFAGSPSSWHYSGTFYWLRNADVFSRDWRRVDQKWWGGESWPGLHFRPDEAGVLFHEGRGKAVDLFSMNYLKQIVEPAYAEWQKQNAKWRQPCLTASS